jgi:hypothetical protein
MLVDCATRKFKEDSEKIVWVLIIIFTQIIGALAYYFVIYAKHKSLSWFWHTLLEIAIIILLLTGVNSFINNIN